MPSRFASLYSRLAVPVLEQQLAEGTGEVVWYPLGNLAAGQPVTAIFVEEEAHDDASRGHENLRKAALVIFDNALSVDARDLWGANGAVWIVRAIARGTDPAVQIDLEFREFETRSARGTKTIL